MNVKITQLINNVINNDSRTHNLIFFLKADCMRVVKHNLQADCMREAEMNISLLK